MPSKRISALLLALALSACSGTVVLSPLAPEDIDRNYAGKIDTTGVIVFRAVPMVEVDRLTQISHPAGTAGGPVIVPAACTPLLTRKLVSIADYQHPYRLHYDHGVLETYTFAATLNSDGILLSINSQSTPDQGKTFQNLAAAAASGGTLAARFAAPGAGEQEPCTSAPVFVGYERPPATIEVKDFGQTR